MCQELCLQHSQEDSVHGCMCGSGVEGNGMGMEQRIENTLSAMQNLLDHHEFTEELEHAWNSSLPGNLRI